MHSIRRNRAMTAAVAAIFLSATLAACGPSSDDAARPTRSATLRHATDPVAQSTDALGSDGYHGVSLGESYAEAVASGDVVEGPARSWGHVLSDHDDAFVCMAPDTGVTAISSGASLRTPEGIGPGSTVDQLLAAYPDATKRDGEADVSRGIFGVDLGHGRSYEIDVEADGTVSLVILRVDEQTCFE